MLTYMEAQNTLRAKIQDCALLIHNIKYLMIDGATFLKKIDRSTIFTFLGGRVTSHVPSSLYGRITFFLALNEDIMFIPKRYYVYFV